MGKWDKRDQYECVAGIERPDQVDNLRRLGGALGQGFLFSRPVSAAETTRLLDLFAQRPPASDGHRRSA